MTRWCLVAFAGALLALSGMAIAQPPGRPPTDVNVINTPDVEVVNVPTVEIGNGEESPVPVRVQEDRRGFQHFDLIIIPAGEIGAEASVPIPAGKRLVVQHVSAFAQVPFGQKALGLIATEQTVDGRLERGGTYFPFTALPGYLGRGDLFTSSLPVLLFADSAVFRFFKDSDVSAARVEVGISGYLVDP